MYCRRLRHGSSAWCGTARAPLPTPYNLPLFFLPILLQAVEAWEQRVVRYGQGQLGALEDRLGALEEHVARIGRENLQELGQLGERIR